MRNGIPNDKPSEKTVGEPNQASDKTHFVADEELSEESEVWTDNIASFVEYEAKHFRFDEANRRIGQATLNLMLGWYLPRFLYWLGKPIIFAMMDDPLIEAFHFSRQAPVLRKFVAFALSTRGRIIRLLPPRRKPRLLTQAKNRTYPDGYEIEKLGPPIEKQRELAATLRRDADLG